MYKLILMLFITVLMFGCSKEEASEMAEDAKEHAGEMAEDAKEHAGEMAEDAKEHAGEAADAAKEMMAGDDDMKGPEVEPLPDWDSLPPIEEAPAEGGETMMEKAEEVVEKTKEHAGDAAESAKEHAGKAAEKMKN